ncbi:MAG: hypothetical protein LBU58_09355, partial [Clostridiales bacterium]|nr:hypothetical protein [Clostridiales bacterium]
MRRLKNRKTGKISNQVLILFVISIIICIAVTNGLCFYQFYTSSIDNGNYKLRSAMTGMEKLIEQNKENAESHVGLLLDNPLL